MRLRCSFEVNNLPVSYNMLFVSLIKECIKKVDENYFNELFYYKENANKKSKNYSFSVKLGKFSLNEDIFEIIDKNIFFTLSSPDIEFIANFYNGLHQVNNFSYKDFTLRRKNIYLLPQKKIDDNEVVFRTLSPICIKNKIGKYLDIEDKNFKKELNYLANLILMNYRGKGLKDELDFKPIDMKKVVVKVDNDFIKDCKKYYNINSYKGIFKLKGDIEDLDLLYQLGLSFRRNQGFGMLEVM